MNYVLITAAYNECDYIENTIISVLSQTQLPIKWVIVSDASSDATDEIVQKYAEKNKFIKFHRINKKQEHNFCSKVNAINSGYKLLSEVDYDFIGNLDADIKLPSNYYQRLIELIKDNKKIGIASGKYIEKRGDETIRFTIPRYHTPGSIQLFRSECYKKIGGYPLINGGEDTAAGITARMIGWDTISFDELEVLHLRPMAIGNFRSVLRSRYRLGESDYNLGMHPKYAAIKLIKRVTQKPYLIGGLALYLGYLNALLLGKERVVTNEFIEYFRKEQSANLDQKIKGFLSLNK